MQQNTTSNEPLNPGQGRLDIYNYLESQGFKMNDEKHKELRRLLKAYSRAENEKLRRENKNLTNILGAIPPRPKVEDPIPEPKTINHPERPRSATLPPLKPKVRVWRDEDHPSYDASGT